MVVPFWKPEDSKPMLAASRSRSAMHWQPESTERQDPSGVEGDGTNFQSPSGKAL